MRDSTNVIKLKVGQIDLDRLDAAKTQQLIIEESTVNKTMFYEGEMEKLFFGVNAINVILDQKLTSADLLRALNAAIPQINDEILPERMTLSLACVKKRFSKGSVLKIALWVAPRALSESDMPVFNIRNQASTTSQHSQQTDPHRKPSASMTSSMNTSVNGSVDSRSSPRITAHKEHIQQQQQQHRRQMGDITSRSGSLNLGSKSSRPMSPISQKKAADYMNANPQGGVKVEEGSEYLNIDPGASSTNDDVYANVGQDTDTTPETANPRAIRKTSSASKVAPIPAVRRGSARLAKTHTVGSTQSGGSEYLNIGEIRETQQAIENHIGKTQLTKEKSLELANEISDLRTQLASRPKVPSRSDSVGDTLRIPHKLQLSNARECRAFHDFSHIKDHAERRKVISGLMQITPSGSWLLRFNREKGMFVITIKYEHKTYHFPMHKPDTSDGSIRYALAEGEPHHEDPSTLLKYYLKNKLPLNVDTCLLHPVLRKDMEGEDISSSEYANIPNIPKSTARPTGVAPTTPEKNGPVPKPKPRVPAVGRKSYDDMS